MELFKSKQLGVERMIEFYELVYVECKILLDVEVIYKRRIKQFEDEFNQFFCIIEDLCVENKVFRFCIDDLEFKLMLNDYENVSY